MSEAQAGQAPEERSPQGAGRWAKVLVLLWGALLFAPTGPLLPGFCCVLGDVLQALHYSDRTTMQYASLAIALLLLVGPLCGGVMTVEGIRSLVGRPSRHLRLPPLWAVVGGFVLALATGLGLWELEGVALLSPWFVVAAGVLAPLAAVTWAMDGRPDRLNWRRASVSFSAGATVSVILAIVLEILVPYTVVWLLLDLGEPALRTLEGLLDALAGNEVARSLTDPGFLLLLFELALVAPLVEELVKPLVTLPLLGRVGSRREAFLLGALAGAGFAAVEDVLYAAFGGPEWAGILLVRALSAAVHPLGAGLTALGWHELLRRRPGAGRAWIGNFALAVGLHALWNGGQTVWLALSDARFFGWNRAETDVLGIGVEVGLLALLAVVGVGLLVGLRAVARRLDKAPGAVAGEELPGERAIALWAVACLLALLPVGLAALSVLWR